MTDGVPAAFGEVAESYARSRPGYPAALFDWVAQHSPALDLAWDVGAGSGQASVALAEHFAHVVATDASAGQIAQAVAHPRVEYRVADAEHSGLADASVDCVSVAQALHWLPFDAFYAEVRRVARPGALIAAWSYHWATTGVPEIDEIVENLSHRTLAGYWPAGREHVDSGYTTLPFPFERIDIPPFEMTAMWTLDRLLGYLRSWSATSRYIAAHGTDPVSEVEPALAAAWGDPATAREIHWPLAVLAAHVD